MKKTKLMLSIGMLAFAGIATTLTSCGNDDEPCPVGYEGTDCETLSRAKFIGDWNGSEECDLGSDDYTVKISASGASEIKVIVDNVYNEDFQATGTMTSGNKFEFNGSETTGGITTNYSGTGTLNTEGELVLDYDISMGTTSNSCVFTGSKL